MIEAETDAFPVAEACVEGVANGGEFTTVGAQTETVLPSGNIEEAMAAYGINYCASSFDELYGVLEKWASLKK